jgi:hypothetical protein
VLFHLDEGGRKMALPWIKLHVSLIDNDAFKRLSTGSKLTFYTALGLAGKQDQDGALAVRGGPMTVAEIASYTGLSPREQVAALGSLVEFDFLSMREDSTYVVERWESKAGDGSRDRTRRYRDKQKTASETSPSTSRKRHRNVTETKSSRKSDGTDKEIDKEIDTSLLRKAALGFMNWPVDVDGLRAITRPFLAAFGNVTGDDAIKKHGPKYAQVLSQMRGRGVTISAAWQAFTEARAMNEDRPLFGDQAKTAMSYLPSRSMPPPPGAQAARPSGPATWRCRGCDTYHKVSLTEAIARFKRPEDYRCDDCLQAVAS